MAKRLFCSDIEGDGLLDDITRVWCASNQELDSSCKEVGKVFTSIKYGNIQELFGNPENIVVMHNGIAYDKPALEKVIGFKVEAEVVDTLFLSWYLYPKRTKHSLESWGEELDIPKLEINDWEGLSIDRYIARCERDVAIQTALWKQMWKHLMLLYGSSKACWHLIRHLNFKAKCAAMQKEARWKLDIPEAERQQRMYDSKLQEAKNALESGMPQVPKISKKTRPKKPYKVNGELSAIGKRWYKIVEEHVDPEEYYHGNPVDYEGEVEVIVGHNPPNANSSTQLKNWLYELGWIPETFKFVRNKETNKVRQIPQIKNLDTGELCASIERLIPKEPALEHLREMSIVQHRGSITKGLLESIDEDGFVHAGVQGLTNTLRFKHKICVNLPTTRKKYGKEIRSLLKARNDKLELCGADLASVEDRTKQHYMYKFDPEYVKEMQDPDFDAHLDMAIAAGLLTEEESSWFKRMKKCDRSDLSVDLLDEFDHITHIRHGGKETNYSATYGAKAPTIARAAGVKEEVGAQLYEAYWIRNWSITAIADECIVKNSRGMKWLWNPVAKLWLYLKADKDRFSTLNQSTATYCFDRWVHYILLRRPQLTAQFHDEVVTELKKGFRKEMTKILKDAMVDVNEELKLNRELDCDVSFGDNYSEVH